MEVQARVDRDGAVLASTLPALANVRLPLAGQADVTLGDVDYRESRFTAREPDDQVTIVRLFAPVAPRSTRATDRRARADGRLPRARLRLRA